MFGGRPQQKASTSIWHHMCKVAHTNGASYIHTDIPRDRRSRCAGHLDGQKGRPAKTPGVKREDEIEETELLEGAEATEFRSLAALGNYISLDRVDVSFSVKELAQRMARPRAGDVPGLKRLARYLAEFPECRSLFHWQSGPTEVSVYTDSDWAGCTRTRRSTSGGIILLGSHLVMHWSRTQQTVALSSCEAELNAMNKGGTEGLGLKHLLESCGVSVPVVLRTDASAAKGVVERAGAGKVKHLSVKQLWAQDQVARGALHVAKVPRAYNASDLLTHHWMEAEGSRFLPAMGQLRVAPS